MILVFKMMKFVFKMMNFARRRRSWWVATVDKSAGPTLAADGTSPQSCSWMSPPMPLRRPPLGKPVALAPMWTSSAGPEPPVLQRQDRFRMCRVRQRATGCGHQGVELWHLRRPHLLILLGRTSTARVHGPHVAPAAVLATPVAPVEASKEATRRAVGWT